MGIFAAKKIPKKEEVTSTSYQFQSFGEIKERCTCGSQSCTRNFDGVPLEEQPGYEEKKIALSASERPSKAERRAPSCCDKRDVLAHEAQGVNEGLELGLHAEHSHKIGVERRSRAVH
jgi:hypothetical protein